MKPLVIYHAHCTDGFGAAYAAWLKLGDDAEYRPTSYDQVKTDHDFINTFGWVDKREVYVLDFSFPPEVTKGIIQRSSHFTWLDHHKTAFENWAGEERQLYVDETEYTHIVLDNNKSGAMLAWEYFHPETPYPVWVQLIDDRDRWQFKYEGSKPYHAGMQSEKPWSFEQWQKLLATPDNIVKAGNVLMKSVEQQVQSTAKYAMKCLLVTPSPANSFGHDHFRGLAANTNVHMSEVGNELANKSGTFGLIWYMGSDNKIKCSLRSNGDYDVSAIAKQFGGGGHKNAAGFETDINTLMSWLK